MRRRNKNSEIISTRFLIALRSLIIFALIQQDQPIAVNEQHQKGTLDFTLCLPPDSVIEDFCQIVTPMYDLIASNIVENQSLAKTRDSLLPRLMSGELDVSAVQL